jgi:1-acyl-sn-glycerol-3-phosphate acyltransferase
MLYFFLKYITRLGFFLYCKRVIVEGIENIPKNGAVIFTPNHQSAFMDAILPAVMLPRDIHFLARADIFKGKWARKILAKLHIRPVYRQRDGLRETLKNIEVFEGCNELLREGGWLLMFPEASQAMVRRVRPLSKGFTRIAFGALESAEKDVNLYIIPMGINYEHYSASNAVIRMKLGAPILVNHYLEEYRVNPTSAARKLTKETSNGMKKVCLHISETEEAKWFGDVPYRGAELTDPDFFHKDEQPKLKIKKFGPAFLVKLMHFPVYLLIRWILTFKVKDPHFQPSIKFAVALFLVPVYYILILLFGNLLDFQFVATILVSIAFLSFFTQK